MVLSLAILLSCQLLGEGVARGLNLPVPGPVLGMAMLLVGLRLVPQLALVLRPTVAVVLANLSLMFVPAGVGVVGNLSILSSDWLALSVVLVVSTLAAMLATVGTFLALRRWGQGDS